MQTPLWSLVDNWSEIYSKICRDKNFKPVCDFIGLKNNRLQYKCKECKKGRLKPINGLTRKFSNTYEFCNGDINKFVLLLRKGVYPYEHRDSWEKFNESSLPDKNVFYNELNLESIIDKDYTHALFEEFRLKNLGNYHDLYVIIKVIHYCLQMYLRASVLKYVNLNLLIVCLHLG